MTYAQAIQMCDAILARCSDGMILTLRGECVRRRATQTMLKRIQQKYDELN